jgi:TatD DNase family protein
MEQFIKLAEDRHTVAIGEVGLDYFREKTATGKEKQQVLLQVMCQYAKSRSLPLVIHCRDKVGEHEAADDCLQILRDNCSPTQAVYLHAFNYGLAEAFRWVQIFPNCVFGICPKVLDAQHRHPQLIEVVRNLDSRRLLLETDAPYMKPKAFGLLYSHGYPSMVYYVADVVAQWRGSSLDTVLMDASRATHNFYRL